MVIGLVQGLSASIYYLLVTEFFDPKYKTKAFFAFSVSRQVADSVKFMTPLLINKFGWRLAWNIGGGFGASIGLMIAFTVRVPKQPTQIVLSNDEN